MRTRIAAAAGVLAIGGVAIVGCGQQQPGTVARPAPSASPTAGQSSAGGQPSPSTPAAGSLDPAAQRYLDAVAAKNADALAACFALDGLVIDVGREIRGRDAIRQWAANEVIGGVYTLLEHKPRPGGVTMLVRFQPGGTGGFRANYHFDITGGLITKATLEYA